MDAAGRMWPRADLRVGDADRQAVVDELQRHYIDGRLTSDELGERVTQTLSARTFGELAVPLVDLPPLSTGLGQHMLPAEQMQPDTGRGYRAWPPLGVLLVIVGVVAMVWMFVFPGLHWGAMPFWPIMIWGFFIFGRPHHGGGRRHF